MTDETREKSDEYKVHDAVKKDIVSLFAGEEALIVYDHFFRNGLESGKKEGWNEAVAEVARAYFKWIETGDPIPFSKRIEALKR